MTSTWFSKLIAPLAVVLVGAGCTISLGGAADGGVWRSTDHGQSWASASFVRAEKQRTISLNDTTIRMLSPVGTEAPRVIAATRGSGIWQSIDGGDHWTSMGLAGVDVLGFAVAPDASDTVYAAVGSSIQKTVDGGKTWTSVYTESQANHAVQTVSVNPLQTTDVWAFTTGGKALQSSDGGATWSLRTDQLTGGARGAWFDRDGSGRVYVFLRTGGIMVTDQRGATWTSLNTGLAAYQNATTIYDFAISAADGGPWYIATAHGLLRSLDRGVTWTTVQTLSSPDTVQVTSVAINPNIPSDIVVVTGQKIQRSQDAGQTWSVSTAPTKRTPVYLRYDPTNPDRLWFGTFKKS